MLYNSHSQTGIVSTTTQRGHDHWLFLPAREVRSLKKTLLQNPNAVNK